jgi:hypothetical protein
MEKKLKGKFLVRRGKLADGTPILQVSGVFFANFIDEVKDNDEMWVSELTIGQGLKFTDPVEGVDAGSAEEFLAGRCQSPRDWKHKSEIYD